MSRLTVRLPDTLHSQLTHLAESEGISLNHFIVYALTRQVTMAYTVHSIPASEKEEQRQAFAALLQGLGQATSEEIEAAMAEREEVSPETELTPDVVECLRERLGAAPEHRLAGDAPPEPLIRQSVALA